MHVLSSLIKEVINRHGFQRRKYTGERYAVHLAEVAGLVVQGYHLVKDQVPLKVLLAVAWSHDLMEDQGLDFYDLHALVEDWGDIVQQNQYVTGVFGLSDLAEGNRAERMKLSRERISKQSGWIQMVKCYDIESNARAIFVHDQDFFTVFVTEALLILDDMHAVPKEIVDHTREVLETLMKERTGETSCPKCHTGRMHTCTRPVGYITANGEGRYIPNVEGRHCTHCTHFETTVKATQLIIDKRKRQGGIVPFK